MTHEDYIYTEKCFAWYPVRTQNSGWVWWEVVERTTDERPEYYQGLLPIVTYKAIKS